MKVKRSLQQEIRDESRCGSENAEADRSSGTSDNRG